MFIPTALRAVTCGYLARVSVLVTEGEGEWVGQLLGGGAGRGWQRPEAECLGRAGDQEVGEAAGGARHGVVDGHGHGDSPPADQRNK